MLRRQRIDGQARGTTAPPRTLPPRRGSARWLRVATAMLAVVGATLVAATPAHALPSPVTDNFEFSASQRWTAVPGRGSVAIGFHLRARSGVSVAIMNAWPAAVGNVAIHRTLAVDSVGGPGGCYPEVYLRKAEPFVGARPPVTATLRVRSGGPGSAVLSETPVDVTKSTKWTRFTFGGFHWQIAPFTVEIVAFRGELLVDDFLVHCVRDPR